MKYKDFSKTTIEDDLVDDDAVKASVMNIVLTQKGSIPGNPAFGSNIYSYIFEPMTMFTQISLIDNITSSLYKNDTRLKTVKVNIIPDKANYSITINIQYTTKYDKEPKIVTINLKG